MKKVLLITTRQLCYGSGAFFAARLAEELENAGVSIEYCELGDHSNGNMNNGEMVLNEEDSNNLESFMGRSFDAVIDFNSKIPRMIMDDGSYYIDHVNAPFYNYIVDNPLYHHLTLSCELSNYNVILVDKNHCDYVRQYYKHIRKCIFLPLGASCAVQKSKNKGQWLSDKERCVLFIGTYRNPQCYIEEIDKAKPWFRETMHSIIELMLEDTSITMVHALYKVLGENGLDLGSANGMTERMIKGRNSGNSTLIHNDMSIPELMNRMYMVEMYLRNYHRKNLIDTLVDGDIPVKVVGDWWDGYDRIDRPNVEWNPPVRFGRSFDVIAKHRVLADSSPFFKMGIHDRVWAGMANHTAVLTDDNQLKEVLNGKADVMQLYSLDDMDKCVDKAARLLTNDLYWQQLVDNAYVEYEAGHTWKRVAAELLKEIAERN